jgi:hypothetical protein
MLQENNRNIFPVSCVLSSLSEISDHGDCFIIANCLTETPEYFEVYSEFSGLFQSVYLFISQLHAELLTMISGREMQSHDVGAPFGPAELLENAVFV